MSVTLQIARTWRAPRQVMREMLAMGPREDRAIAYLMVGCLLVFIAQWPRMSRTTYLDGVGMDQQGAYGFFGVLVLLPLLMYGLAAVLHGLLRLLRQPSEMWSVRVVLFWSLLAASPAMLLYGLAAGLVGPAPGTQVVGAVWLVALAVFVAQGLREARVGHG